MYTYSLCEARDGDTDGTDSAGLTKYCAFAGDLSVLVANWKKKDTQLSGNCPRPE
jgi:hypothetical protein